jgi:hypothetical protein
MNTISTSTNRTGKEFSKYNNRVSNVKPVIKLSPEGILLYANTTGVDFLEMLSDYTRVPALNYLLKECPAILDPHCNIDLCCKLYDLKYYFSVVAFKEAGYVGMYGYRIVHLNSENKVA